MNERKIKVADIEATAKEVYEKFSQMPADGSVDPRMTDVDTARYGVAIVMADGSKFEIGDSEIKAPLGSISKVALAAQIQSQKEGKTECGCKCAKQEEGSKPERMPVSVHGVRLMSKVEPTGDLESKWNIVMNALTTMMGEAPELNNKLYESMMKTNEAANVENEMAKAEFYLYDDAALSINLYTRLTAMQASARQLAEMGATLACGGKNPLTGQVAYDDKSSALAIASMAVKGPHKRSVQWLTNTGVPAKTSFGGTVMAVVPGVMAIAAYSPLVNDLGTSIKAIRTVKAILGKLNINAFAGQNIVLER